MRFNSVALAYAPPVARMRRRRGATYVVAAAAAAPAPDPDVDPPVVSDVTPPAGATLQVDTAVSFSVTDAVSTLRRSILHIAYAGRQTVEVIHDGVSFTPLFSGSSRVTIPGGYRYTVRRTGGWVAAPRISIYAIDGSGNEVI